MIQTGTEPPAQKILFDTTAVTIRGVYAPAPLLERGLDADLVDEEVAQDNEREHRLGLKFAYHNQSQIAPQAGDANKSQTDDNS